MMALSYLLAVSLFVLGVSSLKVDFKNTKILKLSGPTELKKFKESQHVRVVYYYKKNVRYLNVFYRELEHSAEYLDLYQVQIGFLNCSEKVNKAVHDCKEKDIEKSVHTYRASNTLLSLELETMFDVNAIMSNILQLVLLKEVPILQSANEVERYLRTLRGKQDVLFGHMKAIGTFDHRAFMEVAYAYNGKLKFVICTDKAATKLFEASTHSEKDMSTLWWVWTKKMSKDDTHFHNIRYKGEISLTAIAKFAKAILVKPMFDIPAEGWEFPYFDLDLAVVRFYYDKDSMENAYQKAYVLTLYYAGTVGVVLINHGTEEVKNKAPYSGPLPALSVQKNPKAQELFMHGPFSTDDIAAFMEQQFGGSYTYQEARGEDYYDIDDDAGLGEDIYNEGLGEDRPPGIDFEAVELQDDNVATSVHLMENIPMKLDLVPALTDESFPETLKTSDTVLLMFYFPFDAVSKANLRMFGEAVDKLGEQTTISIGRVNCFDWTDVCQAQNIIRYPTLRVFKKGKLDWDYRGPQDIQAFYSTLKILVLSPPIYIDSKDRVTSYLNGGEGTETRDVSNITVLGLFSKDDKEHLQVFKELAESSRDRLMFAYTDIPETEAIAAEYQATLPAVILCKHDDTVQPHVVFKGTFTTTDLAAFIVDNKLPKLTTLTPLMFPEIRHKFSNMLILFSDGTDECQQPKDVLREIVKMNKFNNVSFSVLSVEDNTSVGYKVLNDYTPQPTLPHISVVKFQKGEVFNFDQSKFDSGVVTEWLTNVLDNDAKPSKMLSDREWKPANRGYEFLKIMDWERERDQTKSTKKKQPTNVPDEVPTEYEDQFEPMSKPIEESEDSDTRRDLLGLRNSRLYHQAPGRHPHGHKVKDTPAMADSIDEGCETGQGQTEGHQVDENNNDKGTKTKKHDPSEL